MMNSTILGGSSMDSSKFLDLDNKDYKIQVVAPTYTYGTMKSLDSKFDFDIYDDEYDTEELWEYNIVVKDEIIATFNQLEEVQEYLSDM